MPQFNLDQYLQSRQQSNVGSKLDEIVQARDRKLAEIASAAPIKQTSLVDKMGLQYTALGSVVNLGASVASGASRVLGDIVSLAPDVLASMEEGQVKPEQFAAYNRTQTGQAQPGDAEILNGSLNGTSRTVLDQINEINSTRAAASNVDKTFDIGSIVDQRSREGLSRDLGAGFDAPWEKVKQGWASVQSDEKLKGSADIVSGLAQLVFNAGAAAVNNPQAATEYIAENLPQLAIGLAGKAGQVALGASNVGYAIENYRKGIEEYQAKNQGQFPDVEQRQYMAMMAASTGLAEIVGDASLLKGIGKAGEEAADAARKGFKASILGTAKAGAEGVATEAITEGYQTFAEGEAGNKPASAKDIYEGIVIGGLAGGGLAGGGRAITELAGAAVEKAAEVVATAAERQVKDAAVAAATTTGDVTQLVDPASKTFDPEAAVVAMQAFAARKDSTLDERRQAMRTGFTALNLISDQVDEMSAQTPPGNAQVKAELASIVEELKATDPTDTATVDELKTEQAKYEKWAALPVLTGQELIDHIEKLKVLEKRAGDMTDVLGTIDVRPPAAAPKQAAPAGFAEGEKAIWSNADTDIPVTIGQGAPQTGPDGKMYQPVTGPDGTATFVPLDQLKADPKKAAPAAPADEIKTLVASAAAKVDPADPVAVESAQAAVVRVINLSMQSPESLAPKTAMKLAADTSNSLTPVQRTYLRQFSEAQVAINLLQTTEKVAQEVYFGDSTKNQVGIATYQARLSSAVEAGNQKEAQRQLKGITAFVASHTGKLEAVNEAFKLAAAQRSRDGFKVERTVDGQWTVSPVAPGTNLNTLASELKKNGGARIHIGSEKLVKAITAEAKALQLAQVAMKSAVALTFSPRAAAVATATPGSSVAPAATTAAPVAPAVVSPSPIVSAAPSNATVTTTPAVTPAPTTPGVAAAAPTANTTAAAAVVPGAGTTTVEATGVTLTGTSKYVAKDQGKADKANKFIGQGSAKSSTAQYAKDFGEAANTGVYTSTDRVFISAEGNRDGRKAPDFVEIDKAMAAGATLITDVPADRNRGYNTGERQVASYLAANGYVEAKPGEWTKSVEAAKPVEVQEAQPTQAGEQAQAAETEAQTEAAPVTPLKPWLNASVPKRAEGKSQDTFTTENLLSYVKQVVGKLARKIKGQEQEDRLADSNLKPLAVMPDFLAQWNTQGEAVLKGMLPQAKIAKWSKERTAAANTALEHARETLTSWIPDLAASMPMAEVWENLNKDFREQDMMQFFATGVDADGRAVVPESVLTAMAYAAYSWTLDKVNAPANLTYEKLREMHSRPEGTRLNKIGVAELAPMASFEETAITDLGQSALQVLGIVADKDTPKDFIPRLQNALGTHALLMMERQGLIVRKSFQNKEVAVRLFNEKGDDIGPAAMNHYVGLVRADKAGDYLPSKLAKAIKDANYGSGGVVDLVFGSNKAPRVAATEPSNFTQEFAKGTTQRITKRQAKVLQDAMQIPHTVIPEMLDLFVALGREGVLKVAGWVDLDNEPVHSANYKAIEAQNMNLENQYDQAMEMMELPDGDNLMPADIKKAKANAWYITHSVWRNYRVGISTNSLNQQTSKIHRYLFTRPNWKTTIDPSNEAQMNRFLVSLGQNLGLKTDKQPNAETVQLVKEQFLAEGTDAAIAAAVIREGNWSPENQALVAKFAAKEGIVALQALQALAAYQASEGKPFEVTLLVGADGKTNGPILTHLALGAAGTVADLKALLNRGGMYFKGDKPKHYSQFAKAGGQDLYEDLSRHVLRAVRAGGEFEAAFAAVQVITKNLDKGVEGAVTSAGRNLVKTPLTAFAFGSALKKATTSMEQAFLQSFYDSLQDIASGKRDDVTAEQLITAMNVLLKEGGAPLLPTDPPGKGLALELNKSQEFALARAFDSVMGVPVRAAMESYFGTFIERRTALNATIGAAFDLYQVAYTAAKEKLIAELVAKGELASRTVTSYGESKLNKRGQMIKEKVVSQVALADLTEEQEAALRKSLGALLPILHTDYSKSEDDLDSGMLMAKSGEKISRDDLYQNQVNLGAKTEVVDTQVLRKGENKIWDKLPTKMAGIFRSSSVVQVESSPGVAGTPGAIHSSDSSVMHKALAWVAEAMGLNVHDEINTGVDQIDAAAVAINKATVDTFLNYSPAAEARDMLQRQMEALKAAVEAGTLPASVIETVGQVWADALNAKEKKAKFTADEALVVFPVQAVRLAYEADKLRLEVLSEIEVMDQYTWEGGQFNVGDDIRAEAVKRLAELKATSPEMNALSLFMVDQLRSVDVKEADALYDKVAAIRKKYDGKREAEQDSLDRSPQVTSTSEMSARGVIAPELVAALPDLPVELKTAVASGTPVVEALDSLEVFARTAAVQTITTAASNLTEEQMSPWGELGGDPEAARHDQRLVSFLAERGQVTAMEIYPVLKEIINTSSMNQGMITLLNRVTRMAGPDFTIRYITKDTPADQVLDAAVLENSRGWYVASRNGKREAYILGAEFKASAVHAEVVLHEMLHEVLSGVIENPSTPEAKALVSELEELLVEVRKHPDAKKFGNATQDVHELVSWGMTNRRFQAEVLSQIQVKEAKNKGNRLIDGMTSFIQKMRAFFFGRLDVKSADKATNALTILLTNTAGLFQAVAEENAGGLARTVEQNRSQTAPTPPAKPTSPLDKFNLDGDAVQAVIGKIREGVASLAEAGIIKNSRFGPVKLAGAITSVVAKDMTREVLRSGLTLRDQVVRDRQGFIAGMLNSVQGPAVFARELLRMAKKNEKTRKQMIEDTAKLVVSGFKDGDKLSKESKAAVTQVFLRSGAHVLLDSMGMADVQKLLTNPTELAKAIDAKVSELGAYRKERHYYQKQAKGLAYVKVTGMQRLPSGMLNAGNIARLYGTPLAGSVDEAQARAASKTIDALVALYALQYQEAGTLKAAADVLATEMARPGKENGVEQVLLLHKELERQSRDKLFQSGNNDALRMHGYTPEIYNPGTSLVTANSDAERTYLAEKGYTQVLTLPKDRADPDRAATTLHQLKDGGSLPYLTGAVSLKGEASKGNARFGEGLKTEDAQGVLQAHRQGIIDGFKPDPNWDPRKAGGTFLTPVLNSKGQVANWRYLMSEANKDDLLERDNRMEYVLGALAGSIFDKESSKAQNADVVQALFEMARTDYASRPASYVTISAKSPNAEMRELYRLLPDYMKEEIKDVWGPTGMKVPYELLDVMFGYRKLSAATAFDKLAANRQAERTGEDQLPENHLNALEDAVTAGVELSLYLYALSFKKMSKEEATTWSRAAGVRVRRTEKAWQEIVGEIKDIVVVRGITTMIGNIKSNMSLLLIQGVNPITGLRDMKIAWKGAVDYKRDRQELAALQLQLDSGYTLGNEDEMKRRVKELELSLEKNPVRELIDAGLLPTIVEDVETDYDPYSYKSLLAKKTQRFVDKVNPGVRNVGRYVYMTQDTWAYKNLSQIAQLSDFTARYALYQHLVSRKKNPLSKETAIEEASESFVNYDIPMHRSMQYLDDMGITMFTKYYLNIQRVLLKLGKDKPIQVLIAAALHQYFGRLDLVTESGLPYRFGFPSVKTGPFEALGALDQLPVAMISGGFFGSSSGGNYPQ